MKRVNLLNGKVFFFTNSSYNTLSAKDVVTDEDMLLMCDYAVDGITNEVLKARGSIVRIFDEGLKGVK